ncbi:hypothetical protein [Nostoc sp.]|uniref:hypothetical protein n=1 Tax=Nostoc sp. TaxID=1180 RepID=UPI002FF96AFB
MSDWHPALPTCTPGSKLRAASPLGRSNWRSKVKSQKYYGMGFLWFLNGEAVRSSHIGRG